MMKTFRIFFLQAIYKKKKIIINDQYDLHKINIDYYCKKSYAYYNVCSYYSAELVILVKFTVEKNIVVLLNNHYSTRLIYINYIVILEI